jgi:SAM-dependent methyltransferase
LPAIGSGVEGMAQNIYDDPEFFAGYARLGRSVAGLDGAPEWPALRALLPPLAGLRVVDLGCGYGWFCRWTRERGAAHVFGLDLSEKMLARARADTSDAAIIYVRADLESLCLAPSAFDLAYSSLALHYVADLEGLFASVHRALVPGGRLVFSAEHPVYTAPISAGWSVGPGGRKTWPVEAYLVEGPRTRNWMAPGVVKQHRTLGTYINLLIGIGFTISYVEEWGPTDAQIRANPALVEERERPMFFLLAADRQ